MDYYFRTEKMSVGYGKRPLIEQIEIGLNKGEILTLIGPNGAGKSTVLKSIAKQLALLDGTVYSQNDIAALLGISRSYVSRIEKKALGKLRKKLDRA